MILCILEALDYPMDTEGLEGTIQVSSPAGYPMESKMVPNICVQAASVCTTKLH